jgi:hypothetical protein
MHLTNIKLTNREFQQASVWPRLAPEHVMGVPLKYIKSRTQDGCDNEL